MEFEIDGNLASVPHVSEYFGPWAMMEERFNGLLQVVRTTDLRAHIANATSGTNKGSVSNQPVSDGLAIISLRGVMTKSFFSLGLSASTVMVRRQLREAASDPRINGILLVIDSPGGTVAGTADLAADVAKINSRMPVVVFIEDVGASAAYWVGSQGLKVVANSTAAVGSIGVYMTVEDWSAAADRMGVKVHVVKSSEFKGAGESGTEITAVQLSEFQRVIDQIHSEFVGAVMRGRGMSAAQVSQLADGRIHIVALRELGLVDAIGSFEDAVSIARGQIELDSLTDRRGKTPEARAEFVPGAMAMSSEDQAVSAMTAAADEYKKSIGA